MLSRDCGCATLLAVAAAVWLLCTIGLWHSTLILDPHPKEEGNLGLPFLYQLSVGLSVNVCVSF